nr:unnamed protein product [Callosobruchus analis]
MCVCIGAFDVKVLITISVNVNRKCVCCVVQDEYNGHSMFDSDKCQVCLQKYQSPSRKLKCTKNSS